MELPEYEHPAWQCFPDLVMRPGGLTVTEQALAICDLQPGAYALDVGCGTGVTLGYLAATYGWTGFGVDISAELLSQAHQGNSKVAVAQAKGEILPIASESMDIVLAECTLSIFEAETALAEFSRVLKPGGYLIVSDLYARQESGFEGLRQFLARTSIRGLLPLEEVVRELNRKGLRVQAWQDCSEYLKDFPLCTLSTATEVSPFDLVIAAAKAKLGYYVMVAQKA